MSKRLFSLVCAILFLSVFTQAQNDATLLGKIVKENDAAVADLPFLFYGSGGAGNLSTDSAGAFRIDTPPGEYDLSIDSGAANANNLFNPGSTHFSLAPGQTLSNFVIRLKTTSVLIHGFVQESNGTPIPDVQISLYHAPDYAPALTDATGAYSIRVYPSAWKLRPEAVTLNRKGFISPDDISTNLVAGDHTINFTAHHATITLSGKAIDDQGAPVSNLKLAARKYSDTFLTTSETNGDFSVTVSPGTWSIGSEGTQETYQRGYFWISYEVNVANAPVSTNIMIPRYASQIQGVVQDPTGHPIPYVSVDLRATINGFAAWLLPATDSNGVFTALVPNATWSVQPSNYQLNQLGYIPPAPTNVTVLNQTNNTILLIATPPPFSIQGTIRDENGAGVSNIMIRGTSYDLGYFKATSDATGHYSLPALPGRWSLQLDPESLLQRKYFANSLPFDPNSVDVPVGTPPANRDFSVLNAPYIIKISIIDDDGSPLTPYSASVTMFKEGQTFQSSLFPGSAPEFAVFPGAWQASVQLPPDYRPESSRTVTITDASREVQIIAHKWMFNSTLSGQVIAPDGSAISNIAIHVSGPKMIDDQAVDTTGHFNFNVPSGAWYLSSADPSYLFESAGSISVPEGGSTNRVIHARRLDAPLTISLHTPNNDPVPYLVVSAHNHPGNYAAYKDTGDTNIVTLPLFPGEWTFNIQPDGPFRFVSERAITIPPGGTNITIDLLSSTPTSQVRGKIVNASGLPIPAAWINVANRAAFNRPPATNAASDGSFQLGLYADDWDFQASVPSNKITALRPLHIIDGQDQDLGAISLPDATQKIHVRVVDTNGLPISMEALSQATATRFSGPVRYWSYASAYENNLTLDVSPGPWEIILSGEALNQLGYKSPAPALVNVTDHDINLDIVAEPLLRARPAPKFTASVSLGIPKLRLTYDHAASMEIQSSSDLTNWNYHSTMYFGESVNDLYLFNADTNHQQFFRAKLLE